MSRFLRLPGSAGARLSPGRSSPALTGLRGPPPGHRLRSGGYMAATKKRDQGKISPLDVSTLSGEPRSSSRSQLAVWAVRTVLGLTCEALSTGVRWRPLAHAAIVTHFGTRSGWTLGRPPAA